MTDQQCVEFLQWALPRLRLRWPGFRKVRRQVHKRIDRRMSELHLAGVTEYRFYLSVHPAEWSILDAFCRISISRFYRDRSVFDYLGNVILPDLARLAAAEGNREIRAWCAGCASGEEVYTLAILWQQRVRTEFPDVQLRQLATDVDEHMLQRASRARYSASSLKDVPADWFGTALAHDDDEYVVRPEFRARVEFRQQDIRTEMPDGPFHLILCRHLAFTYFDDELQREILHRILARLAPGGVLVAGKQEPLPVAAEKMVPCGRNLGIYRV